VNDLSNAQLLAELRAICGGHERAVELLDEVGNRLDDEPWVLPTLVVATLKEVVAKAGRNTIEAVERRCRFAHRVWLDKYGPYNADQGEYETQLMCWVIRDSGGNYGRLYAGFDRIINHENVDLGFKKRKGDVPVVQFDAMELLT
jgi:hypothetical protein